MKQSKLLNLGLRIICSLIVTALIAFAFMKLAGGAAMFCIDPPAADPGWEWKVPLAWSIIYGSFSILWGDGWKDSFKINCCSNCPLSYYNWFIHHLQVFGA